MSIKVLLADKYKIVLDGLKSIFNNLSPKIITIVSETSNGYEVVEISRSKKIDVFILEISIAGLDGIHTVSKLVKNNPHIKTIILSIYNDKTLIERAFEHGAMGYVLKEAPSSDLINAIIKVNKGYHYASPQIPVEIWRCYQLNHTHFEHKISEHGLTLRQQEILKHICDGLTEREIADMLHISPNTVHVHKTNIMNTLDLHNKADLVRYSIREKIVSLD